MLKIGLLGAVTVIRTIFDPKNGSFRCPDKLGKKMKQLVPIQTKMPKAVQTKFAKFRLFGNCLGRYYPGS